MYIFTIFTSKQSENTLPVNNQLKRRPTEDLEETTPTVIANQALTAAVTEESGRLALNLNHLKERPDWYISHKDFISQCININLVQKGLDLTLEPEIGKL